MKHTFARSSAALLLSTLTVLSYSQRIVTDTTFLEFVGTGNVQRSLDNGEGIPASTGLGVILDEYHVEDPILFKLFERVRFSGQINVASTADTLLLPTDSTGTVEDRSMLGEAIMTPLVGRKAADLDLTLFFDDDAVGSFLSGINLRYTGSNRLVSDSMSTIKATMNAFRVRLFHDIIGRDYNRDFNVIVGVGYAYNSIRGDIALPENDAFRTKILGTSDKAFTGPEVYAQFRLRNIRAEFSYTWLDQGGDVPGLSGGRMVTTISFVGGFPVKIN